MAQILATWVQRFATRLIELQPHRTPLDAVRFAASTYADASELPPEEAAEMHAAFDQNPSQLGRFA